MDPNPNAPNTDPQPQLPIDPEQPSSSSCHESQMNPEQYPEHQGESISARGCNCKKSKCMKMYCECYFSGIKCMENCRCLGCENVALYDSINNRPDGQDEAEANRKIKIQNRGCNCKKSQCSKKYCECFNAGIFCNNLCKCQQCKNILNGQTYAQNIQNQLDTPFGNQNPQQNYANGCSQNGPGIQDCSQKQANSNNNNNSINIGNKNKQFNQKLQKLLASVSEQYKASMLEFVYYLLK